MTGTNGNGNVNSISRESQYNMESTSLLAAVGEMSLQFSPEQTKEDIRDQTLFITGGVGGGGVTWFLGEQKGGSVVTENPIEGIAENFGRIQRGDHSNLLGKWRHGERGSQKSSKVIRGDHFSKVTFKGGIG